MPLVAVVAGQRVESWQLDDDAWLKLKGAYRSQGCDMVCGKPGFPKTSPRGLQYFSHKPGADCKLHEGGPESAEHLLAKAVVAGAARACGWAATVECPAPDRSWIADVMLERGDRRVAVEVQWSPQSDAEFARRQHRYTADGVECFWLVGPKNYWSSSSVPAYPIDGDADALTMDLPVVWTAYSRQALDLAAGLTMLLTGQIRQNVDAVVTGVVVGTAMRHCWRGECCRWLSYWYVSGLELKTRCGRYLYAGDPHGYEKWSDTRVETFVQDVVRAEIERSDLPLPIRYDSRYSKQVGKQYLAQVCPHCGAVQGDGFVGQRDVYWRDFYIPLTMRMPLPGNVTARRHLCRDVGHGFCPGPTPDEESPLGRGWRAEEVEGPSGNSVDRLPAKSKKRSQKSSTPQQRV